MAEPAKARRRSSVDAAPTNGADPSDAPSATDAESPATTDPDAASHGPATCPVAWCPVCLAVTAVQPVKPEVVEHLMRAGTEFFLAMRSLIDARADDLEASGPRDDGSDGDLHRIDIG
ncbi:MAG TPA: hypothetical protein VLA82_06495 [Actinomycetota bacterium]|nr:hypothetical protein [Actinomycetota bacterium]